MGHSLQTTIARAVTISGMALHTGTASTLTLRPAEPGSGLVWRRVDLPTQPILPARPEYVSDTVRCTALGNGIAVVKTVEHVQSALRGMGIDNCLIDVSGEEPPAADGSAAHFAQMIVDAGTQVFPVPRREITLSGPVVVSEGRATLVALPADTFRITCTFTNDHNHPALEHQFFEFDLGDDAKGYRNEIAPARTIAFLSEIEALKERGLALGGSLDLAVVLGEREVVGPLRFPDEPVRHKVLDLIGDLALVGSLRAHVIAVRPSHRLNTRLAAAILAQVETAGGERRSPMARGVSLGYASSEDT